MSIPTSIPTSIRITPAELTRRIRAIGYAETVIAAAPLAVAHCPYISLSTIREFGPSWYVTLLGGRTRATFRQFFPAAPPQFTNVVTPRGANRVILWFGPLERAARDPAF